MPSTLYIIRRGYYCRLRIQVAPIVVAESQVGGREGRDCHGTGEDELESVGPRART